MPTFPLLPDLAAFAIGGAALVLLLARIERFWGKPLTERTDILLRIALCLMAAFLLMTILFDAFGRDELLWFSRFSTRKSFSLFLGCLIMALVPRRFLSGEEERKVIPKQRGAGKK